MYVCAPKTRYSLDLDRRRRGSRLAAVPAPNGDRDGIIVRARGVRHEVYERDPREVPVLVDGVARGVERTAVLPEVLDLRIVGIPERLGDREHRIEDRADRPLVEGGLVRRWRWLEQKKEVSAMRTVVVCAYTHQ